MTDIIIDTDIGDDIDDAYALTFAARSPALRLVGVTTVFRDAPRRAQMTLRLLRELGHGSIPVRAGCDFPFLEAFRTRENDRHDAAGRFIPCQHAGEYDDLAVDTAEHAVDFIIRMGRENPGRITLVGIGPLTNIGMALRKAPELKGLLRGIVLMGGVFSEQFPEWNILCDPEAAAIVVSSGIPLSMVGLDVTMQCPLPTETARGIGASGSGAARLLDSWTRRWSEHYRFPQPVLHDPLAVAAIEDPSLVTFAERDVVVALEGKQRGCTLTRKTAGQHAGQQKADTPRVRIAMTVEAKRFTELFVSRVVQ